MRKHTKTIEKMTFALFHLLIISFTISFTNFKN